VDFLEFHVSVTGDFEVAVAGFVAALDDLEEIGDPEYEEEDEKKKKSKSARRDEA